MMTKLNLPLVVFMVVNCALNAKPEVVVNENADFEKGLKNWIVYKGPGIEDTAVVEVKDPSPQFNSKHIFMRLPTNAKINGAQYTKLGQLLQLSKNKRYRYSIDVQWINTKNSLKSAIISVWTNDSSRTFNGKDEWLRDGRKHTLSFEFSPTADGLVDCYVALLTHQDGFDNTDILLDNFKIEETGDREVATDPRPRKNIILNPGFEGMFDNWNDNTHNPTNVSGLVKKLVTENGNTVLQLELPAAANNTQLNNTWTGVNQPVKLYAGNTYKLSVDIKRIDPDKTQYPTIVNIFAYRKQENGRKEAWLDPIRKGLQYPI